MQLRNRHVTSNVVATTQESTQTENGVLNVFEDESLKERVCTIITNLYTTLGAGRRESVYQRALQVALSRSNIECMAEYPVPLMYQQKKVGCAYLDLLLPDQYFFEIKANSKVSIRDVLQVRAYSRETRLPGFLVNFPQQLETTPPEIFLLEGNSNRSETLSRTRHSLVIR